MDQTHCAQVKALLSGEPETVDALPPTLKAHTNTCDRCSLELAAAGKLTQLLKDFGEELVSSSTAEQMAARAVLAASPEGAATGNGGGARSWSPWAWAALGAMAAAGVAFVLSTQGPPAGGDSESPQASADPSVSDIGGDVASVKQPDPAAKSAHILTVVGCRVSSGVQASACAIDAERVSTGPAERAWVTLSDGTTVTLNYGSEVAIDSHKPRSIDLRVGEAYVDVVRQAGLPPLAVALPSGRVDVIGTKLTLRAQPKFSVVSVVSGKVKAHGTKGAAVDGVGVGAGEQAVMVGDQEPVVSAAPNLALATDWARERPEGGAVDDGASTTGFGTLTARKPGASKDTEGQALRLADHRVKVAIQGVVARTEITEVFANDTGTTLEGVYSFPLPPGAQIAALDLEVEGRWEHGAVVERERGEKIWRGVIRNAAPKKKKRIERREWIWVPGPWKDPALMQWKQGSRFELRIFPIPARGSRRVRIAYTTPMVRVPGGRRYVMPLAGSSNGTPSADRFEAQVRVGGGAESSDVRIGGYPMEAIEGGGDRVARTFKATAFKPAGALVVDVAEPPEQATAEVLHAAFRDAQAGQSYAMFNLRPRMNVHTDKKQELRVVVLVDRSYSTQEARVQRSGVLVADLIERLGAMAEFQVLGCAAECVPVTDGWISGSKTADAVGRKVAALEAIGASNVQTMLESAAAALRNTLEGVATRVIVVGDGVATAGEVETERLSALAKRVLAGTRLTTVSLGGEVDAPLLRALADAGAGAYVAHGPGATMAATAWEVSVRQIQAPVRGLTVRLPEGAREVVGAPSVLWPGQELLVSARIDGEMSGDVVLSGTLDGQAWERRVAVSVTPSEGRGNAFVPRMWAQGRIAELERRSDAASRRAVVTLSKRHHVLSRHTSLIVLESAAMARAFKVDDTRPAVDWDGEADADVVASSGRDYKLTTKYPIGLGGGGAAPGDSFKDQAKAAAPASGAIDRSRLAKGKSMGRPMARRRPPRGGWWQKTVWYRTATIRPAGGASAYDDRKLTARRARLAELPGSRERTRDLVRWHVRMGNVDEARTLVERWLDKDRMDIDALTELAGIEALEGNFKRSEALLASIVDVDRTADPGHARLHELYVASGRHQLACHQAVARGLLTTPDAASVAGAMRCSRVADSDRFLDRLTKASERRKALKLAAKPDGPGRVSGKLKAKAQWSGQGQVDLVVVTPKGRVVTWQGGDQKTTSALSQSLNAEELGVRAREVGRYRVYAVRRGEGGSQSGQVEGSASVRSYSGSRREAFSLAPGQRVALFDVRIERKSRIERRRR